MIFVDSWIGGSYGKDGTHLSPTSDEEEIAVLQSTSFLAANLRLRG